MLSNTHFSIAVHVLSALAYNDGKVVASEELARTVGTNPSFLRGLIGQLRDAGLVQTRLGKGGGTTLAKAAGKITLKDVYKATESQPAVKQHVCNGKAPCPVARGMDEILTDVNDRVEKALATELKRMTVADLLKRHVS